MFYNLVYKLRPENVELQSQVIADISGATWEASDFAVISPVFFFYNKFNIKENVKQVLETLLNLRPRFFRLAFRI